MRTLYGVDAPKWFIRWRGLRWLRYGLCPWCYSSPPRPDCPICHGTYDYGNHASGLGGPISDENRERWRWKFLSLVEAAE